MSGYLSDSTLGRLRASFLKSLAERCTVKRDTFSLDAIGGQVPAETTIGTYPCRLAPLGNSGPERQVADRLETITPLVATLPYDADIRNGDRIEIGTRRLVVAGLVGRHSQSLFTRCICSEAES